MNLGGEAESGNEKGDKPTVSRKEMISSLCSSGSNLFCSWKNHGDVIWIKHTTWLIIDLERKRFVHKLWGSKHSCIRDEYYSTLTTLALKSWSSVAYS